MNRTAVIATYERLTHQVHWGGAFGEGLERRGWNVRHMHRDDVAECDLLVLWGVRRRELIERQKKAGGEVCILERGYLGDRMRETSVSFGGGLNGRGEFRCDRFGNLTRFRKKFRDLIKPRDIPQDGYALLIGQVPGDMSIAHVNIEPWYQKTATDLLAEGWCVKFRPHPMAPGGAAAGGRGLDILGGSLAESLAGAAIVVTFNSNMGVDAALFGRPVVAFDEGSMAWPIAGKSVSEIIEPPRLTWAARLAWCQYSEYEMRSGFCQERVGL